MYLGDSKQLISPWPQFYDDCSSAIRHLGCADDDLLQCMFCSSLELGRGELNPYLSMVNFGCIHLFNQTLIGHIVASKVLLIARIVETHG